MLCARVEAHTEKKYQAEDACVSKDERMVDVDEGSFGSRRLVSAVYSKE